jgi:hypothetical protein
MVDGSEWFTDEIGIKQKACSRRSSCAWEFGILRLMEEDALSCTDSGYIGFWYWI